MRWKFPVLFLVLVIGISPSLPGRAEEWKTHTIAQLTLELPEGWFRVFGERPGDPGGFIRPLWEGEPPEGEQIFQSADILVVLSGEYAAGPIEELKQSGTPFTEEPITIGGVTTSLYRAEFMGKEAFMVFLEGSKLGFGLFLKKGSPEARRILESITIGAFPYPLRRLLGQEVLDSPQGVACDLEGRVYVANHSRHQVVVFGADGTLLFTFGEEGMEPGKLFYPAGIALDPEGYIYVTDSMNRIQKFDRKGNFLGVFGKAELQNPKGIAVDREGNVYVVEVGASRVTKLDREGKVLYSFGDGELTLQDLVFTGIAIGKDGEVLVSDPGSHRVAVFDPSGKFLRSIERVPRVRGISLQTDFTKERPYFTPAGIAVDHRGDIYVADNHSGFLLHFDAGGNLQEAWGTLEDHQFPFPVRTIGTIAGVACSPGMIYAAREVTPYALFGFANPSPVPFLVSEIRALPLETPPPSPGTLVAEETPPMPSPSPSPGIVLPGETSPVPSLPPGTALAGEASQPPPLPEIVPPEETPQEPPALATTPPESPVPSPVPSPHLLPGTVLQEAPPTPPETVVASIPTAETLEKSLPTATPAETKPPEFALRIEPEPAELETGKPLRFSAILSPPPPNPVRYVWNFGDGTQPLASDGATVEHRFIRAGQFTLTVKAFDTVTKEMLAMERIPLKLKSPGPQLLTHREYYPSGKVKLEYTYYLDNQGRRVKHGTETAFYENGQKKFEGTYEHGKKEGVWVSFYDNGVVGQRGTYRGGLREGTWTLYYRDGKKESEGPYRRDKREGKWVKWLPDGRKFAEMEYRQGEIVPQSYREF
uniref:PKD domain-containing protein n=1 Tax=Candidatus Caldatribacterium saccharofermentans TaxID=1454753 RepID=A0A7V4TGF0_9BACT